MAQQSSRWMKVALEHGSEVGNIFPAETFSLHNLAPMLFNCFSLLRGPYHHIQKRPLLTSSGLSDAANGTFRGIHYWSATGKIYYVVGTGLYSVSATTFSSPSTLTTSLDATARFVGFAELNTGSARYLILLDGVKGWYIDTSDVETQISDGDFPTPHIPTPVCFDGYVFVAKSGTQDIYNSLPADPTTWQASTFIRSEQFNGLITALASQKNQLVVFHTDGLAFFKDAGRAAPNSPLQRIVELSEDVGLAINYNIVRHSDSQIYFLGTGPNFVGGMYKLENQKLERLDSPIFEQILTTYAEFDTFGTDRRLLSLDWFGQTFLLWEPLDPEASGASAITMVLNAKTGQLAFWGSRDPDNSATSAFGAGAVDGIMLPLGIIGLVRVEDQFVGWSQSSGTSGSSNSDPLKTMTSGLATNPNPVLPNTKLLNHFNGADLGGIDIDEVSNITWTNNINGMLLDTAQAMFGSASALLDQDFNLVTAITFDEDIAAGDWTLEGFIRRDNLASFPDEVDIYLYNTSDSGDKARLEFYPAGNNVGTTIQNNSTPFVTSVDAVAFAANTWFHFALVRDTNAGTYDTYFNGSRISSESSATNVEVLNGLQISTSALNANMWIDELRVSKVARYSGASITPPSAEFILD